MTHAVFPAPASRVARAKPGQRRKASRIPFDIVFGLFGFLSTIYWLPGVPTSAIAVAKYGMMILALGLLALGPKWEAWDSFSTSILTAGLLLAVPILFFVVTTDANYQIAINYALGPVIVLMFRFNKNALIHLRSFGVGLVASTVLSCVYVIASWRWSLSLAPYDLIHGQVFLPYNRMGFSYSHTISSPTVAASILICLFGHQLLPLNARLVALLPLTAGLVLSTGEAGMVALATGIAGSFLGPRLRGALILGVIACFFSLVALPDKLLGYDLGFYLGTIVERLVSLDFGVSLFMDYPVVGVGPGQSGEYFFQYAYMSPYFKEVLSRALQPHASIILLAAELGFFGVVYAAVLFFWIVRAVGTDTAAPSKKLWSSTLIAFVVVSFLEPWPFVLNLFISIWPLAILGFMYAVAHGTKSYRRGDVRTGSALSGGRTR